MTATRATPAVTGTAPARTKDTYLHGLDLLRVIASTAVVYAHLIGWFETRKHDWGPGDWVARYVSGPLHLTAALLFDGVAVFMLISGVVTTRAGEREGPLLFLYRRLARILPAMIVAITGIWIMINLGLPLAQSGQRSMSVGELFGSFVFAGFFHDPTYIPLGVVWTLVVQIGFYLFVAATIPVMRRQPWLPPAIAACLSTVVLSFASGPATVAVHEIGSIAAYLPVLIIGQLISLVRQGRVHPLAGTALGATHFLIFIWADRLGGYTFTGEGTVATLAVAILGIMVVLPLRGRVCTSPLVKGWANRTYAIFLVHQAAMYPIMDALTGRIGVWPALAISIVAAAVAAELLYRLVEVPATNWLRRVVRHPAKR